MFATLSRFRPPGKRARGGVDMGAANEIGNPLKAHGETARPEEVAESHFASGRATNRKEDSRPRLAAIQL